MTTPTGQISLGNIRDEFGSSSGSSVSLGNYRVNQTIAGRNWTLDSGVPSSGQIGMSQLRGKTLNVVVDYSGGDEYYVNSLQRYDSSGVVVGGFKVRPAATSTQTKIVHHIIRKRIGGARGVDAINPAGPKSVTRNFVTGGYTLTGGGSPTTFGAFITTQNLGQEQWKKVGNRFQWVLPTGAFIGQSSSTINSPTLNISGGDVAATMTLSKTTIIVGYRTGAKNPYTYYKQTIESYTPTITSRGSGYSLNQNVSTSWDGRSFSFIVSKVSSSGPAFRTGSLWSNATLNYYIASGAVIAGSGGNGGKGAHNRERYPGDSIPAGSGERGGDAFGVVYNCNIIVEPGGSIRGGGGGGGGGGFSYSATPDARWYGSGGGGGAGIPGGSGGIAVQWEPDIGGKYNNYTTGKDGRPGTDLFGGQGGTGWTINTKGGNPPSPGGNGGWLSPIVSATAGANGNTRPGGSPGAMGSAFRVAGGNYSLINSGTIVGGRSDGLFIY